MYLTRPERNSFYEAIAETGLDPAQCKLEVSDDAITITHGTGSSFTITPAKLDWLPPREERVYISANVIDGSSSYRRVYRRHKDLLAATRVWAAEVKKIIETPDYWKAVKQDWTVISDIQDRNYENTPFTPDERDDIAAQLQDIRVQLEANFELTREQISQIDEKLGEAAEASSRMGRKDWLVFFGGAVFNLIVTDTVTPPVAGHIFTTVVQGLAHLFMGVPPQIVS